MCASFTAMFFFFLHFFFFFLTCALRRYSVLPDQRMIYEETNSYSQRNYAERRRDAGIGLHASDEREGRNVTQRPRPTEFRTAGNEQL
jgi:hypothetical protein